MSKDHNYFADEDSNNEVDAVRAACRAMNSSNLWIFAQRAVIIATESQRVMKERFPEVWDLFDSNIMRNAR